MSNLILPALASVAAVGSGAVFVGFGKARKTRSERGNGPRSRPKIVLAKSPVEFMPAQDEVGAGNDTVDTVAEVAAAPRVGILARLFGRKPAVERFDALEDVEHTGEPFPYDAGAAPAADNAAQAMDDTQPLESGELVASLVDGQEIRTTPDGRMVITAAEAAPDVPAFGEAASVAVAAHENALDEARAREEAAAADERARELEEITARAEGEVRALAHTSQWWVRLAPALDPEDVSTRKAMAGSLGRLRDDWAVDLVRLALTQETEAGVRARLIASFAKMEVEDEEPYLRMLTSDDEADRKAAMTVLARIGTPWSELLLETAK